MISNEAMTTENWLHKKYILRRASDMVSIDVRLKNEDVQILQAAVGKKLDRIEHDEFVFTNTSSQAVRFVLGDAIFYLYSFTEPLDYYGSEEDVAVWSVEEKEYPLEKYPGLITS